MRMICLSLTQYTFLSKYNRRSISIHIVHIYIYIYTHTYMHIYTPQKKMGRIGQILPGQIAVLAFTRCWGRFASTEGRWLKWPLFWHCWSHWSHWLLNLHGLDYIKLPGDSKLSGWRWREGERGRERESNLSELHVVDCQAPVSSTWR